MMMLNTKAFTTETLHAFQIENGATTDVINGLHYISLFSLSFFA